ncbi:Adaptive-response sensory-kinase SasA [Cupriavidus respiraculi]|uniref:histidine kinase n=2 Tax=Cupriavidus respiraculi TaxID=195930 RepID=A0ABM8WHE1_9BURK|nr:Adaptive-response sensory-kinase SasA [Cupriavidus respiraculi]
MPARAMSFHRPAILLLLLWLQAIAFCAPAQARPWRVVILPGADLSQPAASQQVHELRAVLNAAAPQGVEFYVDALDSYRFDAASMTPHFVQLLKAKYANREVDLVIGVSEYALQFAGRYHEQVWPGVPVLITSIDATRLAALARPESFTYLPMAADIPGTLDMVAALQPELKRLIVVTGAAPVDRYWGSRIDDGLAQRASASWQVETWSGLTQRELVERVAGLDRSAAVLFATMYADRYGAAHFPYEVMGALSAATAAPLYGWYETYMRYGMAAGSAIDFAAHGRRTGEVAAAMLRGELRAAGTVLDAPAPLCVADVGRLEAFGLDAGALPAECRRLNVPASLWRDHRALVLGVLATVVLQALTIGALLWQRRWRRRAEDEAAQRRTELTRAARIASIGELSASIAHEVSQPLGAILTNADAASFMLDGPAADTDEVRSILDDVRRDALRANQVVQRQRAMLRKHELEFVPLRPDAVLEEGMDLLRPEARRRGCELRCRFAAADVAVMGDPVQLQQVLVNLVINAMDAVQGLDPARRRIMVETRAQAGFHVLNVTDRGPGMAAEVVSRVFESFYTTKPQGTGLGLSIVRAIVAAHGGEVCVTSEPERGTTFEVRMPAAGAMQPSPRRKASSPAAVWTRDPSPRS